MVWLILFGCLIAYGGGLFLLVKVTPSLIKRAYDEALFIGIAAGAVFGAMLAFGGIGVIYAVANGATLARFGDGLLLILLGIVTVRTAFGALRPRYEIGQGTYRVSRLMAGGFYLALASACLVLLFLLLLAK